MDNTGSPHDLAEFMVGATRAMQDEYIRIRKRAKEDPGTAGDQGEENWARLLREWLPASYHVVTKGRILTQTGRAGPQVDVLVLDPSYPPKLLETKLYLAGAVAAAFECKLTLKSEHIANAVRTSCEIKRALPRRYGTPYRELTTGLLYGVLAHSHCWRGKKPSPTDTVQAYLCASDEEFVKHPREMVDLVCVADLATWSSLRLTYLGPQATRHMPGAPAGQPDDGETHTAYVLHSSRANTGSQGYTPIGAFITELLGKLAWERPWLRDVADYFRRTRVGGQGKGPLRRWSVDVYTEPVRKRLKSGAQDPHPWSEWMLYL